MHETQSTDSSALAPDDLTITYVGGGSRQWAPKFVQDMALADLSGSVRLYDVDGESAALNARFGDWVQSEYETVGDWEYGAVDDLGQALEGADAVVASTQYDPAETFVHDLDVPLDYGIYGAVSATIGPGGIFRAMRTIPVYRKLAAAIREHCPDAWVFNFTNPVHFVTRALYDEYSAINAIGLCHEVHHAREYLAALVGRNLDVDASAADVTLNVKGINHFTWVDEARCDGIDLWPLLEETADSPEANRRFSPADLADASPFVDNQQVTWELFRRFGLFPAAGDRHLVEYADWFLNDDREGLNRWGVKRTGSDYRATHWNPAASEQTTDVEAWLDGEKEFALAPTDEVFADVLEALAGAGPMTTNVNLPNVGQVPDLATGAVVETNAVVRRDEIEPVSAGGFPRPVRSLLGTHVDTIETVIEASRTGDLDLAFQGFLLDPQVRTLGAADARSLFAEMVAVEAAYLTDWELDDAAVLSASDAV